MTSTTAYVSRIDRDRLAMPYSTEPSRQERLPYGKEDSNMQSAGGLVTTAEDLTHWMIANLNGGRWNGRQALPAEAVSLAQTPTADLDASYQGFERKHYSLGLYHGTYDGEGFMHHFGGFSGFHSHISYMLDRKIGVAVLVNNDGTGSYLAVTTAKGIYQILLDRPGLEQTLDTLLAGRRANVAEDMEGIRQDRARRAERPQDLPHPLEAYAGTYRNEDFGTMVWTVRSGKLHATWGVAESDVEVYDGGKNQVREELLGGGGVIQFEFDGSDRAQRLIKVGPNEVFERVE
jgi:CubicO group peptidase (beta-lactamase class C family)